ncbi:phage head-tail connector protein [Metabacillus indicus]|uniref:phage head-tail connector protein n=1 Tax=Metabacillus indicus TaxID=246786 RepID=UPI002A06AA90|nr:phage head-tail connector protein [Metabacillus indicus]MDX8288839.1 phage head-tail connector protein [Metabacillus indicus]
MYITPEILDEFKGRMRITHSSEDDYLSSLLNTSYADIKSKCGPFDIKTELRGRELVFERARYSFNDALEYFDGNFLSQILSFSLDNLPAGDVDEGV